MTVSAVGKQDNSLSTVVKSTALGTAAGYSMKYLWRVDKRECDISDRKFINLGRKIANENKLEEFSTLSQKSAAQDAFIKMIEQDRKSSPKGKVAFSTTNIAKNVRQLGGENSASGKELQGIIRDANNMGKSLARRIAGAYRMMMKFKRPAIPFLVAGAGVGFLAGFIHNVIKTDV